MASTLTVDNIVGATAAGNVHMPGGVVQVVQGTHATTVSISTGTYTFTGLTADYNS